MTGPRTIHITDHALLRYLERVEGLDIAAMRTAISDRVADAVQALAPLGLPGRPYYVRSGGFTFILGGNGDVLVTVLSPGMRWRPPDSRAPGLPQEGVDEEAIRETLPPRRAHEVREFQHRSARYTAGTHRAPDGRLLEVFIDAGKAGSDVEIVARDGAVLLSLLLQHGCPAAAIRAALSREEDGTAQGPLGALLDLLEGEG